MNYRAALVPRGQSIKDADVNLERWLRNEAVQIEGRAMRQVIRLSQHTGGDDRVPVLEMKISASQLERDLVVNASLNGSDEPTLGRKVQDIDRMWPIDSHQFGSSRKIKDQLISIV